MSDESYVMCKHVPDERCSNGLLHRLEDCGREIKLVIGKARQASEGGMKPAMTAGDWAELDAGRSPDAVNGLLDLDVGFVDTSIDRPSHRHALAAALLHGQPFGFTWDDVDAIRGEAMTWENRIVTPDDEKPEPFLTNLADRIAALLPPRET